MKEQHHTREQSSPVSGADERKGDASLLIEEAAEFRAAMGGNFVRAVPEIPSARLLWLLGQISGLVSQGLECQHFEDARGYLVDIDREIEKFLENSNG